MFTPEQAMKFQKGSRAIAVPFNLGFRWDGWSTPHPGRFTPGKRPDTHFTGGWLGPRVDLEGRGKSPDRPARSESLYRLCYPYSMQYTVYSHTQDILWIDRLYQTAFNMWYHVFLYSANHTYSPRLDVHQWRLRVRTSWGGGNTIAWRGAGQHGVL
jgi:hypothetical protein